MARPSLSAIADACGVSTATVSRALSGHPNVHRETREQIAAAARKHGYARNELIGQLMSHVRASRTQRFIGNLAFIHVPSRGHPRMLPAHRKIIAGASAQAKALGFQLYEFSASDDGFGPDGYARMLRARGVQGVIFLYAEPNDVMAGFPWNDFAAVEIDYGQREPVLHTVCIDHYTTLLSALERLRDLGYRRIGFFVTRFKDQRIVHKWSATFASFQRNLAGAGKVPMLIVDEVEEAEFMRWHRRYKPDVVVGHVDDAVLWLQRAGVRVPEETAFFSLCWNDRRRPCAGLDLRMELQGTVAASAVISQIQRGEHGLPADPHTIMVRGRWVDGPTLRSVAEKPERLPRGSIQ